MTPIQQLQSAETALVRQINTISGVIANTATDSLTDALATLHEQVDACRARLESAATEMLRQVTDLARCCEGIVAADITGVVAMMTTEDDRIANLTREEVGKELEAYGIDTTAAQKRVKEALEAQRQTLPRPEVQAAFQATYDAAEDDRRNRTPDSELDSSELEDQPEEVERNRLMAEMETVPSVSADKPYYMDSGDKEPLLGVGTGVEAAPSPDVPQPGKNGRQRKAKKGGKQP